MIGSTNPRYVYVSPPKTGVMGFRSWLCNKMSGQPLGNTYDTALPSHFKNAEVFMSVANPYERVLSLWWWSCMAPERDSKCHLYGRSLVRYIKRLIAHKHREDMSHQTPRVYQSMKMYSDDIYLQIGKPPIIIHLESMEADLQHLSFVTPEGARQWTKAIKTRPGSQRPRVALAEMLSAEEEALIWEYCHEDFEFFGYERLVIPEREW